ncbi:hypothetical protein CPI23_08695 [Moraxella catarrhalis]|nr:hypothetical protein [Moraxella catarrhalis]MPX09421.1 hypothetical protein [Moraxella catarrhalis]MPX67217.1 hypothetical protein [Moraxella catarrhalis]RKL83627.1 hypothetical protein D6D55_08700 [Moraxella catarrhalis]
MKLELLPYFYAFSMWIIIIYTYIILAKLIKIKTKNFIILSFTLLIILLTYNIGQLDEKEFLKSMGLIDFDESNLVFHFEHN